MTNRSPVPTARALHASDVRPRDLIAGHTPDGDFAFQVLATHPIADVVTLTLARHRGGPPLNITVPGALRLVALTRHYGRCTHCGRLAPCPDDLAERRLERLWDNPGQAAPLDLTPMAISR